MSASPAASDAASDAVADAVRERIGVPLPLPGSGQTGQRWRRLSDAARADVVVGRLVEAHADADAILAEVEGRRTTPGQWWGVWAAEPPQPVVEARRVHDGWVLNGTKAWCSGAGLCTHALLTVRAGDERPLVAVDLAQPGVSVDTGGWAAAGMRRSVTGLVRFDDVVAEPLGGPRAYLERAGFWHGGAGVAACWLGGALRVADTLVAAGRRRPLDEHALAHLGAVDAALCGARWTLESAAAEVDADPLDRRAAQLRAQRVRALVESVAASTLEHVGRALGATPLATDEAHATAVQDLTVYLRQNHAERDLAGLGRLVCDAGGAW